MCCNCGNHTTASSGGSAVGALFVGVAVLFQAAWWLLRHVAAPLVAILAVAGYRWTTGLPLLPDRVPTTAPTFNRRVTATGRDIATAIVVGILINPLITALITVTLIGGTTATVAVIRLRKARLRKPRRVRATTGTPTPIRRATVALNAARADVTWTEQTVRKTNRSA